MVPAFIVPVEVRAAPQYGEGHCGVFATAPIRKGQKVWEHLAKGNALKLGWLGLGGGLAARTTPPKSEGPEKHAGFLQSQKDCLKACVVYTVVIRRWPAPGRSGNGRTWFRVSTKTRPDRRVGLGNKFVFVCVCVCFLWEPCSGWLTVKPKGKPPFGPATLAHTPKFAQYVTHAGKTRLVILVPWILEFQAWIYDVAPSASQAQITRNGYMTFVLEFV